MDLSFKANLKSLIVILVIGFLGWRFLLAIFHPHDRNQLTLISQLPLESSPAKIDLSGEIEWSQNFKETREVQGNFLYISQINNIWSGGKLTLRDIEGKVIFRENLRPPSRYCGNYVILLKQDGSSQTAWNHFPFEDDTDLVED